MKRALGSPSCALCDGAFCFWFNTSELKYFQETRDKPTAYCFVEHETPPNEEMEHVLLPETVRNMAFPGFCEEFQKFLVLKTSTDWVRVHEYSKWNQILTYFVASEKCFAHLQYIASWQPLAAYDAWKHCQLKIKVHSREIGYLLTPESAEFFVDVGHADDVVDVAAETKHALPECVVRAVIKQGISCFSRAFSPDQILMHGIRIDVYCQRLRLLKPILEMLLYQKYVIWDISPYESSYVAVHPFYPTLHLSLQTIPQLNRLASTTKVTVTASTLLAWHRKEPAVISKFTDMATWTAIRDVEQLQNINSDSDSD